MTAGYIWLCRGLLHLNPHIVSPVSGPPDLLPLLTSLPTEPHLHQSTQYLNPAADFFFFFSGGQSSSEGEPEEKGNKILLEECVRGTRGYSNDHQGCVVVGTVAVFGGFVEACGRLVATELCAYVC